LRMDQKSRLLKLYVKVELGGHHNDSDFREGMV
jgi:hypothetical protein